MTVERVLYTNSHPHCLEGEMHPKDKNENTWIADYSSSLLITFKVKGYIMGHGEQFKLTNCEAATHHRYGALDGANTQDST